MSWRLAAMLQTVSMSILVAISSANLTKPFYKPSFREVESSFLTRSVSTVNACISQCERLTSCVAINFNRRGNMCYLVHSTAGTGVTVTESKRPGLVSWAKTESGLFISDVNPLCPQCDSRQSCEKDTERGTCNISACGKPPKVDSINGNVFTVGSKLAYSCLDHSKGHVSMEVITCSSDGNWNSGQKICGYTEYHRDGVVYNLKIIGIDVYHRTALSSCAMDGGAKLLAVTSKTEREHMESILDDDGSSDEYWVDAQKDPASDEWYTSDGRFIKKGLKLWANVFFVSGENCAMLESTFFQWKLNEDNCYSRKNYVCAMP